MSKEKKKASWSDFFFAILILAVIAMATAAWVEHDNNTYPALEAHNKQVDCFESIESFSAFLDGATSPC